MNDGLSAREITDFQIGADQFLWVATLDGLNRFDGQSFTRFGLANNAGPGLSNEALDKIDVDVEGNFVITFRDFYGYFDRFDPRTKRVTPVPLVPSTGVVGFPRTIVTDDYGRIFAVTIGQEGTYIYEYTPTSQKPTEPFTTIFHEPNDAWTTLAPRVELLPLSNGQFLLYDEEHGFRYLSATGELISRPFRKTANQRRFYTFVEAANGMVYFSFRDGYPLFSWRPGVRSPVIPVAGLDAGLRYPVISEDESGQLLLHATEDILGDAFPQEYYLVDTTGRFSLFEKLMPTDRALTAVAAINFNETVYLGLREGLGVIERYTNAVSTYLTADESDKLAINRVQGICEDSTGTVYAIEEDGFIYAFPPEGKRPDTLVLRSEIDSNEVVTFRAGKGLIYDAEYNALWATAQPTGRQKGGVLLQYDLDTRLTRVYRSNYALGALTQDARGRTYVAGFDARKLGLLLEFDEPTRRFNPVETDQLPGGEISGFKINHLSLSKNGKLLLGTEKRGLLEVDPQRQQLRKIAVESSASTTERPIYTVYEDDENWWLGTDNGLYKVPMFPNGEAARFTRLDGLSSNEVYGIAPDSSGGLWLSSPGGLTHLSASLNPDDFRRYYREDGLADDEFTPQSFHVSRAGEYLFGGVNGITVFREKDFSVNATGADVLITEVNVYGRNEVRVINTDLQELKQVTVFSYEKSVAVSFALPVGHLPSSTQFRYRLEGFNDTWVPLTNERTIRFNNLESGKYQLRIQGAGANGNFGDRETRLAINVRQYIYEHLWFQGLVILMFALLIFWILQSKLRERLRNEQLRTQLSSDIHDEVSGLLAGITLQAELLKNRTDDETMRGKLDRVGEAGRSAMSKMSDVIWSIDSRRDTIGDLLQRMQEHADEVLLPVDIRYDFAARGFDETKELSGNIRQDLYFIYKEAINNIARHSNATKVQIELTQASQIFELFIRDNGRKVLEEEVDAAAGGSARYQVRREKTGQGKDNIRMRAERLKGEITIDDRYGYTLVLRMKRL